MNLLIILGMHRSGTSAISSLANSCGYEFGENLIEAAHDNPKGFWEDKELVLINDTILGGESEWAQINPNKNSNLESNSKMQTWYKNFCTDKGGHAAIKDPRLCRTLDLWMENIDQPRILFIIRNPHAVAASLFRRNNLPPAYAIALWIVYNYEAIKTITKHKLKTLITDYDILIEDRSGATQKIKNFLGSDSANSNRIEGNLRHNLASTLLEDDIPSILKETAEGLYELIKIGKINQIDKFSHCYKEIIKTYDFIKLYPNTLSMEHNSNKRQPTTLSLADSEITSSPNPIEKLEMELENLKSKLQDKDNAKVELFQKLLNTKELLIQSQADNNQQLKEIIFLKNEINQKDKQLKESEEKIKFRSQTHEATQQELFSSQQHATLLHQKITCLENELNSLYNCRSLKATAPLRNIANFLRKRIKSSPLSRKAWALKNIAEQKIESLSQSAQTHEANNAMTLQRSKVDISIILNLHTRSTSLPEITISAVTYNNGKWLDSFMTSLILQEYPTKKIHLCFVDNSSTDDTLEKLVILKKKYTNQFSNISITERPNLGFGAGHDFNIRSTNNELILITNIDLEFTKNSIIRTVSTALKDSEAASWELRQAPFEHPKYVDPVTLRVNWSSHACILISKEKYLEVGGYEKRIFMYGEDVELSYRFRRAGYALRYIPSAVVLHYTYKEAGEVKPIQFIGSIAANFYLRLRYGNRSDIMAGFLLPLLIATRGSGFKGSRKAVLKGLPKMLANAPAFLASRQKSSCSFPFRGFDYDIIREGAFYDVIPLEQDTNTAPLITVVTRTIEGRGELLKQCIASVINQTYPNVEHLIVEDGGASSSSLVEHVSKQTTDINKSYSIQLISCEKKGRSFAGNQGMAAAKGEYIVLLDDDDLLFPDHLEILYNAITSKKVDAAYSLAWDVATHYIDKQKGLYTELTHKTLPLFYQEFDRDVIKHHNYLPIQAVLFSKSLFDKCGGFEEDMSQLEDWVFWKKLTHNGEFVFVKKTTSLYKTPADYNEMMRRKELLDAAYESAKTKPIHIY